MTLYAGISARHVNSYHVNNSLLFQFILSEFIEAFTEIKKLDKLCSRSDASLAQTPKEAIVPDLDYNKIQASLRFLVGSTKDYMRIFSWNFSEGVLTKLKTYCSLFLENSISSEKDFIAIQHYSEKVWQGCLQAIDGIEEVPVDRAAILVAIDKASTAMHRFSKQLARLTHQFRDDENVVLFLLRHHAVLDSLYGPRFTLKLLCRMFSKGLREVQHFLIMKYSERGFNAIEKTIRTFAAEVEASNT